jgi:chemotaxis protein CheD
LSDQAHKDVVLQIGEFHFGGGRTRIRTLLGSCVSITMWHPRQKIGGMCHYLLPKRGSTEVAQVATEGNYAEGAMQLFLREIRRARTRPDEYIVKLFGGGSMFKDPNERGDAFATEAREGDVGFGVADRNVQVGKELLATHGFHITAENVGGYGSRVLIFELWSGDVWLRRGGPLATRNLGAAA